MGKNVVQLYLMSLDRKVHSNSRINLRVTLHVPALLPLVWIMCLLSHWRARYGSTTGPDHTRAEAKLFIMVWLKFHSDGWGLFLMLMLLSLFLKWLLANVIQVIIRTNLNYCIQSKKCEWCCCCQKPKVADTPKHVWLPLCSVSDQLVTHRVRAAAAVKDGKWQCVCRGSQLTSRPSFPSDWQKWSPWKLFSTVAAKAAKSNYPRVSSLLNFIFYIVFILYL